MACKLLSLKLHDINLHFYIEQEKKSASLKGGGASKLRRITKIVNNVVTTKSQINQCIGHYEQQNWYCQNQLKLKPDA